MTEFFILGCVYAFKIRLQCYDALLINVSTTDSVFAHGWYFICLNGIKMFNLEGPNYNTMAVTCEQNATATSKLQHLTYTISNHITT